MSELSTFIWKLIIIVMAIPTTFLLIYYTGLLISKLALKYCPECRKREQEEEAKKKLVDKELGS